MTIEKRYGPDEAKQYLLQELRAHASAVTPPDSFPVVVRVAVPLIDIDPLMWLAAQKAPSKVFWDSVDGQLTVAGAGAAFEVSAEGWYGFDAAWERVREFMQACPSARLFSGMSFARTIAGDEWRGFPALRFVLPALEVVKDGQGCWLAANMVRGRDGEPFDTNAFSLLQQMRFVDRISDESVSVVSREDAPDYEDWVCSAEAILEALAKDEISRMVLARRLTFRLDGACAPERVLRSLQERQKGEFSYLFGTDTAAFFGTSSQLLFLRQGDRVHSRGMAGGRPRGKDRAEDDRLRDALIRSDPDQKEHRLVAGAMVEVFREFCRSYQVDCQQEVLRLARQQCLLMRISGVLTEGVTDREFLQALHPAPAGCGVPAEKARLLLQQYEVFDRGWFTGPVGFFSGERTELAVATRSCLLGSGGLHAYATAALARDGEAFRAWEEAGGEMKNILNVVHAARI